MITEYFGHAENDRRFEFILPLYKTIRSNQPTVFREESVWVLSSVARYFAYSGKSDLLQQAMRDYFVVKNKGVEDLFL